MQGIDVLGDVVHSEDRGPALERQDVGRDRARQAVASRRGRRRACRESSCARCRSRPGGRWRRARRGGAAARGCARRSCRSRCPGRARRAPRRSPLDGEREPLLEERLHVGDDVVVARVVLHGARLAEHVHQAAVGAGVGHDPGQRGVEAEGGYVVDDRRAGVERRPRDRGLRRVDGDPCVLRRRVAPPRAAPAGAPRPRAPGSEPGRVDSPPMSRIAAPSAASRRPCSTAATASRNSPPSENESGVTLTTPMITGACTGRSID